MLIDEGVLRPGEQGVELDADADMIHVPPTIMSLLRARLDLLDNEERAVLEVGAVEGQHFHRGAAAALLGLESPLALAPTFERLSARGLVQSAPAQYVGEASYRFHNRLVRDAAYAALTKRQRATLHERFASWMECTAGKSLGEIEEIRWFHLEQAVRYRTELGILDEADRQFATEARCAPGGQRG